MKHITVDIKKYIKSVVDKEETIKWTKTPSVVIPKMSYPKSTIWRPTPLKAFFSQILP